MRYSPLRNTTILTIFGMFFFLNPVVAQIPPGYYDGATGTGATLKTQLYNIIKGHTVISYDGLYNCYKTTDDVDNAGTYVWDIYSDIPGPAPEPYLYTFNRQCGTYNSEGDCYNREHSFPQSWFGGGSPMKSDLFHVIPTDGYVNNRRSNYAYGEVKNASWTSLNGSKVGSSDVPGYNGTVFEPIDEYKGDLARSYFYMVTRYENLIKNWETPMLNKTTYPGFTAWALTMLLKWHNDDPVSQKEIDRNNAVYTYQHNRNPFVDHPEYVNMIWGGGSSLAEEPEAHVTEFSGSTISLQWTDATGGQLPDAYLIRMSSVSFDDIATPNDGIEVIDDLQNRNVLYGVQKAAFGNLTTGQTYYFKIFPYTGSGTAINFKTTGALQISQVAK
ncbi:MAG: endonuclease [Bacteroidales bacterium]|nr:endonuclease [Bacteroidales bacterium]